MRRTLPILVLLLASAAAAQPHGRATAEPLAAAAVAYERGDFEEAAALLTRVVDRDRRNAEAHHLLALVYSDGAARDDRLARRHAERAVAAEPRNVRFLETRLRLYQRELSEERAFSMTDGRRAALARRILRLDSTNAVARDERALAYFLEFDWRRGLAERSGGWDTTATRGMSAAANRALRRSRDHLRRAFAAAPDRASTHRLALRSYTAARDDAGLLVAARQMHDARPDDPDATLYLGLGLYRTGDIEAADTAFARALRTMPDSQRIVFEHIGGLLRPEERDTFDADSAAVTARFWRARDPRLLTQQNERRLEHLARLALADLLFTDTRTGRRGWETTKGEVVVRYGLPRAEQSWLANDVLAKDFSRYNRWNYGDFTLLFEDAFRSGDYEFWSSAAGEDEVIRARSLMNRMPERFEYAPPRRVDFPMVAATFRGDRGTDVVIRYGVSVERRGSRLDLTSGAFLLDADGTVAAEQRRRATVAGTVHSFDDATLWTDGFEVRAAPGDYQLAVEFEQTATGALGLRREPLELPDYRTDAFTASDLLLAYAIEDAEGDAAGRVERRGLHIEPAPWSVFATAQPIYLYVEGYNLTPADDGYNRYAVEVALRPESGSGLTKWVNDLLGRRERGVAVEFEGSARGRDLGEYVVLDASDQSPGGYELTLRLRDRVTGEALIRSTNLFLE
jgi:GWxTD domain-containing protein